MFDGYACASFKTGPKSDKQERAVERQKVWKSRSFGAFQFLVYNVWISDAEVLNALIGLFYLHLSFIFRYVPWRYAVPRKLKN